MLQLRSSREAALVCACVKNAFVSEPNSNEVLRGRCLQNLTDKIITQVRRDTLNIFSQGRCRKIVELYEEKVEGQRARRARIANAKWLT